MNNRGKTILSLSDYNNASRAIHWVGKFTQKNLAKPGIRIETTVYAADGEPATRKYKTSCLIAGMGHLVDFRIDAIELGSDTQI